MSNVELDSTEKSVNVNPQIVEGLLYQGTATFYIYDTTNNCLFFIDNGSQNKLIWNKINYNVTANNF